MEYLLLECLCGRIKVISTLRCCMGEKNNKHWWNTKQFMLSVLFRQINKFMIIWKPLITLKILRMLKFNIHKRTLAPDFSNKHLERITLWTFLDSIADFVLARYIQVAVLLLHSIENESHCRKVSGTGKQEVENSIFSVLRWYLSLKIFHVLWVLYLSLDIMSIENDFIFNENDHNSMLMFAFMNFRKIFIFHIFFIDALSLCFFFHFN